MMTKEEFERLFRKCYNPSITDFEKENGESWNDLAPDFAEKCNYIGEDPERLDSIKYHTPMGNHALLQRLR